MENKKVVILFVVSLFLFSSLVVLVDANAASPSYSGQAVDILQNNVYTYAKLFNTGYMGNAYIPSLRL